MYVVRKAFKSNGRVYVPGETLEDLTAIKRVKSKIADRKILLVPGAKAAQKRLERYFVDKYGVTVDFTKGLSRADNIKPAANADINPTTGTPRAEKSAADILAEIRARKAKA